MQWLAVSQFEMIGPVDGRNGLKCALCVQCEAEIRIGVYKAKLRSSVSTRFELGDSSILFSSLSPDLCCW